ncbi:MAG: radical SAM protein [Planctomycetota bacterium]|nr:MAG: radical SAM protein [Planctomycetota bacterium]
MSTPPPVPPGKRIAALFLLPNCNMGCAYCAAAARFDVASPHQVEGLLSGLAAGGIHSVVFGGGEPLLWPHDLERVGRRARDLGLEVQVGSNGLAPPTGFARFDWVDRYLLPLDAADPHEHDRLRSGPDSHHAIVLARLDELLDAGKEVTIGTVVTRRNAAALPALADFLAARRAAGLRLHAWHLYRFLPVGRGGTGREADLGLPAAAFRTAVERARARPLGFPAYRRDDMLRSSTVAFYWFEDGRLRTGA